MTVVVPCYRYGRFLEPMVNSVLSQGDVDGRVLIVDDASPDGSADVALALEKRYPGQVSAMIHESNRGHIRTYNDGLAAVDTEYVALVSADDVIAPGALGRATRLMDTHPRVGMVYGHTVVFQSDTAPRQPHRSLPETWSVWNGRDWIAASCRTGRNFIVSPEVVMRTDARRDVGDYNPNLPHSGDLEYWLRTAARWDVARVNGSPQAYYRMHGANMHTTDFDSQAVDLRHRLAAYESLLSPDLSARVPGAAGRLARARRAIGGSARILAERSLDRGGSCDDVSTLIDLSEELTPGATDSPALRRRLRRGRRGLPPAPGQRFIEYWRAQGDRARAVLYEIGAAG